MSVLYSDRWIECTDDAIQIRGYYFPWGTKRIPYGAIRAVRQVRLDALHGRGRVWGTASPRYWASLDPRRPSKSTALILDTGAWVQPFITPDDPAAVEAILREHVSGTVAADVVRGPFI